MGEPVFLSCAEQDSKMKFMWEFVAAFSVLVFSFFVREVGAGELFEGYYSELCPFAEEIVRHHVKVELLRDPSMAASLLRLQFHDCFVQVTQIFLLCFARVMIMSAALQSGRCAGSYKGSGARKQRKVLGRRMGGFDLSPRQWVPSMLTPI